MLDMRLAPVGPTRSNRLPRASSVRGEAALAGGIAVRPARSPARPAEIVRTIQHALHRGLAEPLFAESETSDLYGGQIRNSVLCYPGGLDDTGEHVSAGRITPSGRQAWWRLNTGSPLGRRWLQIKTGTGTVDRRHTAGRPRRRRQLPHRWQRG
jgi:hypothetical protein